MVARVNSLLTATQESPDRPPGEVDVDRRAVPSAAARRVGARTGVLVLVIALAVFIVRPLYAIMRLAFEDGGKGFRAVNDTGTFFNAAEATVWLAVGSTAMALVLGIALAWFALRLPRGFGWLAFVPVLPIVLPAVASIMGWVFMFSPRVGYGNQFLRQLPWWSDLETGPIDVNTLPWIVILTGLGLSAFVYLFVSAGLRNVNGELIEAAQVGGSSSIGAFFRVVLPLLRPSIVYSTAVCLILSLGNFTAPLLLGRQVGVQVLTTEMYQRITLAPYVDFGAAAAIAFPLTMVGIILVIGQRMILGNQARFVSHGAKSFRPVGTRSGWNAAILIVYGFLAAVLPLIGLVLVAFTPFWSGKVDVSKLTTENVRVALTNEDVTASIQNSLIFSLTAVAITLPLGFVIASLLVKGEKYRVLRTILDFIVALPLGVPAVMFGFGFLFAYSSGPFKLSGTSTIVVLVYVTLMIPFATRLLMTGMMGLGRAHAEASATCGAGPARTTLKVTIPMMRAAIAGAAALTFILLSHEFSASLLVRNIDTSVMGTVAYDAYISGEYPQVAVIGLVMTVVTAVGLCAALAIGGRRAFDGL